MQKRLYFPIHLKILASLLLVVTLVVGIITFTMARLFHDDKTGYIRDLATIIAVHTAEGSSHLLKEYEKQLRVFADLIYRRDISLSRKEELIKKYFENFDEIFAVTAIDESGGKNRQTSIYEAETLRKAGLKKQDINAYRLKHPLPLDEIRSGAFHIENGTLSKRLPLFRLAFSLPPEKKGGKERVITGLIKAESLFHLTRRTAAFDLFIIDRKGTILAHSDTEKVVKHTVAAWLPDLEGLFTHKRGGTGLEYDKEGDLTVGAFAPLGLGNLLSGVEISKSAAYLTARELLADLMLISFALLITAVFISFFGARKITRPLEILSRAAEAVGQGDFDVRVDIRSRDEIGTLSYSFNQMTSELDSREVALGKANEALVQSEKMSAFGQLSAGIAHEVKNPLAGILGYAQFSKEEAPQGSTLYENLCIIEKETKRCKSIIDNLMKFARQEKMEKAPLSVNLVVEETIRIIDHQLTIHRIKIESELAHGLPKISGNANQLQQVLMNLLINAQQAMKDEPGKVSISTRLKGPDTIEIIVEDTGPGITEEVQARIFDPFFTTKTAGRGTGLGLSVSYGIIKDHEGTIRVESPPGQGTTFILTLPAIKSETSPKNNEAVQEA
ncbi:MAG: ATP-binding protein [Deltaproteobacteria bacterium]|nr:ATP-binding protein [Deltaproteobacteria bacterium]